MSACTAAPNPVRPARPLHPLGCALAVAAALALGGCGHRPLPAAGTAGPPGAGAAAAAPTAQVRLLTAAGAAAGSATLTSAANGVEIAIEVQGMAPGAHGFHIHTNGACAPGPDAASGQMVPFGAAGGHFDPYATRNHGRPGQSAHEAHAGEMPNILVGADGRGTLRYTHTQVTLTPGPTSVLGRTLVVHEREDDYASNPAGNSGARIACGVIESAQSGLVQGRTVIEGANVFPEGIAFDARSGNAYVGSSSEGHLYRIAPGAQKAEMFQAGGSPGRQGAFGMKVDAQGRLWVAGGPFNTVAVLDLQRAATLVVVQGPPGPQGFLNDLVLTASHAYVTDSFRPVLWRIATAPGAPAALEPWLDLSSSPVRYVPNQINLNGIVASADGRWLLAVQSATGQLWRIDTGTRAVTEVDTGGASTGLKNSDGLLLAGSDTLYLVRNRDNEIVRLALEPGWTRGHPVQRLHDARFKFPTTAALVNGRMWVVNAQLNKQKDPPPLLPFEVLALELPR